MGEKKQPIEKLTLELLIPVDGKNDTIITIAIDRGGDDGDEYAIVL